MFLVYSNPRQLRTDEIPGIVDDFRRAAWNAMDPGFDGVEIHGAHGYLLEQFMKGSANGRHENYRGSLENRLVHIAWASGCRLSSTESIRILLTIEPRITIVDGRRHIPHRLLPFLKRFNGAFIAAGWYDQDEGNKVVAEEYNDLVTYGEAFLGQSEPAEKV
ncbi:hypothetical protein PR202_gb17508 [Eleusine coracana subsp. coracana]|uniref:NADH:flavin oxidoreductase/NADH oxidase N-terminal domain-containing protein n=1 Tax=Eleusine coracana subsp. coracana TaxID=191504 RepID=A0AAV5F0S5_ELECO|nr:hypothetical protein PR202_gb17508 [Eleusine coracana subsp. coracana]